MAYLTCEFLLENEFLYVMSPFSETLFNHKINKNVHIFSIKKN